VAGVRERASAGRKSVRRDSSLQQLRMTRWVARFFCVILSAAKDLARSASSDSGSSTSTEERFMKDEFAPVTPGEMLKQEFLTEYRLSQNQLAKAIGISPNRIAEIVNNRRRITADTALRLGLYFGNSPEFWLNLQTHYDLKMARKSLKPEAVKRIKARRAA
jgi:antitoxin HigA-1